MAKKEQVELIEEMEETAESVYTNAAQTVRKFFLASLGAAAMAQENMAKLLDNSGAFANELVAKGEVVNRDGRKMINEFVEPYQKQARSTAEDAQQRVNHTSEAVMNRLNIPSADSIDQLNKKIATLGRKVDQLKKEQA